MLSRIVVNQIVGVLGLLVESAAVARCFVSWNRRRWLAILGDAIARWKWVGVISSTSEVGVIAR